jgi:hypothetical protein
MRIENDTYTLLQLKTKLMTVKEKNKKLTKDKI